MQSLNKQRQISLMIYDMMDSKNVLRYYYIKQSPLLNFNGNLSNNFFFFSLARNKEEEIFIDFKFVVILLLLCCVGGTSQVSKSSREKGEL